MLLTIAAIELRQQLRSHVFWVVFAISALMVGGSLAIDTLRVGLDDVASGAEIVVRVHLVWTLFYLFTAAAFVGDAILRDRLTGMAPLVQATPVPATAYLYGRALGAFAGVLLCFLSVPVVLAIGAVALGWSVSPGLFVQALFVLAIPNLFLASALFVLLATRTGSMTGCLLGAVALLVLYGLGREGGAGVPPIAEPFAFAAVAAGEGVGANRIVWLAVGLICLALAGRDVRSAVPAARPLRRALADPAPALSLQPLATPRVSGGEAARLLGRIRLELGQLIGTPVFYILLALGLASAVARLWTPALAGEPLSALLPRLITSFQLVPITVVLFFSGELYWNERTTGVAPLIAATPVSGTTLYLGKFVAIAAILLALALATGGAAALLFVAGGGSGAAGVIWLYVLPKWLDWTMFAALALLIQSLSPNKLSGWGFIVLFLIASLGLDRLGLDGWGWWFGRYPGAPVPPELTGIPGGYHYRWGWAKCAALLTLVACAHAARQRPGLVEKRNRIKLR